MIEQFWSARHTHFSTADLEDISRVLLSDSVVAMCTPVRDSHISFADLQLHSLLIIPRVQACEALARAQNGCEPTQLLARAETAHLHLGLHAPISSPFASFRARLAEPLLEGFPCVADAPTRTVTALHPCLHTCMLPCAPPLALDSDSHRRLGSAVECSREQTLHADSSFAVSRRMPTANAEGLYRSESYLTTRLAETFPMPPSDPIQAPRRSPSACPEKLLKIDIASRRVRGHSYRTCVQRHAYGRVYGHVYRNVGRRVHRRVQTWV